MGKGGPRLRSGRPSKARALLRRNRLMVMFTDAELAKLREIARSQLLPTGTLAHKLVIVGIEELQS